MRGVVEAVLRVALRVVPVRGVFRSSGREGRVVAVWLPRRPFGGRAEERVWSVRVGEAKHFVGVEDFDVRGVR